MSATIKLLIFSLLTCQPVALAKQAIIKPPARSFGGLSSSSKITATVRQGSKFCAKELQALQTRSALSQKALEQFVGTSIDQPSMPTIGIACSGGGVRAAIASIGLLSGLEKIGLLGAVHYLGGLSGSTWSLASWLTQNISIDQLTKNVKAKLNGALTFKNMNEKAILEAIFNKEKLTFDASMNDLWGCLLADMFLSNKKVTGQDVCLSELERTVLSGNYPIPLFTSVIGETNANYQWVEYSPFEIGSTYLNAWVSPAAFGKVFDGGHSTDKRPEERLSYLIGLFGSAYAASASDAFRFANEQLSTTYNIGFPESLITALSAGDNTRLIAPEVNNFAYHLKGTRLNDEKKLTFIDGGFGFNFPFPPLMRRNVSLYIVCDATDDSDALSGNDMHLVEAYARKNKIKLPHIDYTILTKKPISIWADADQKTPIIIYIKNMHQFSTLKFSYTPTEFDLLMKGIEQTIVANAATIKQAVTATLQ